VSDERARQLAALYGRGRADDQRRWYEARLAEFTRARTQAVTLSGVLLVLATTSAALAAADAGGARPAWAVLATAFPALSAALAGWVALQGFTEVAKLYRDAIAALRQVEADAPEEDRVERVEAILRREQARWGQLPMEARAPEASAPEGAPESP
jgi:hypothetical protein